MIKTELEKVSYSFGVNIAQNLEQQGMTEIDAEALTLGLKHYLEDADLLIPEEQIMDILQDYFRKIQENQYAANIEQGKEFLDDNATREGVVVLPSGLQYEIIEAGDGPVPTESDTVTTHYHGTLIDGTVFDSSIQRKSPATFPVSGVIKGWVEALQLMPVGSKWRLYIPSDLAYGANPRPEGPIEPFTTLIFDIELISIN